MTTTFLTKDQILEIKNVPFQRNNPRNYHDRVALIYTSLFLTDEIERLKKNGRKSTVRDNT